MLVLYTVHADHRRHSARVRRLRQATKVWECLLCVSHLHGSFCLRFWIWKKVCEVVGETESRRKQPGADLYCRDDGAPFIVRCLFSFGRLARTCVSLYFPGRRTCSSLLGVSIVLVSEKKRIAEGVVTKKKAGCNGILYGTANHVFQLPSTSSLPIRQATRTSAFYNFYFEHEDTFPIRISSGVLSSEERYVGCALSKTEAGCGVCLYRTVDHEQHERLR
jgi:hypothetical protein